jgi:peptidoglycan/LPS O-acetylase OafA/YrhL
MSGGYVGVDVFFVISGFVITGVLLRERESTGVTSIPRFYARRVRRIIPAATVVIVVVVLATYHFLGTFSGAEVAEDGRWAAVFLANFHFAASGTSYLASQRLPSPLQNFWSLSVEEQFYLVYPALFLLVAARGRRTSSRRNLASMLGLVIVASFVFSILETRSNPTLAYFSPFTRAWELALGAFVAVFTGTLRRLPATAGAGMSWLGLGMVMASACLLNTSTSYPGSAVALPVIGTALVISGGTARPVWGSESLLKLRAFQWIGLISYSLYLLHWPILTIAAERTGSDTLPVSDNLLWLLVALGLSILSYFLIEKPLRLAPILTRRRWFSIGLGVGLVVSALAVCTVVPQPTTSYAANLTGLATSSGCPAVPASEVAALRGQAGLTGVTAAPPDVRLLLVGDSTACTLGAGLDALGPHYGFEVVNAAVIGCGVVEAQSTNVSKGPEVDPYANSCRSKVNGVVASALQRSHPILVLWSSQWEQGDIVRSTPSGQVVLPAGSPQWKAVLTKQMDQRVAQFTATGAKVVILTQPPSSDLSSVTRPTARDESYLRFNDFLRDFAAMHPRDVSIVDLASHVCPGGPPCSAVVGDTWVRGDGLHYTTVGSLWVARWLMPELVTSTLHLPAPAPLPAPTPAPRSIIASPSSGATATGNLEVVTNAVDNVKVAKVQLQVSNALRRVISVTAMATTVSFTPTQTWVTSWDTKKVPDGAYDLRSVVYDVKGKSTSSRPVTVHVDN